MWLGAQVKKVLLRMSQTPLNRTFRANCPDVGHVPRSWSEPARLVTTKSTG